MIRKYYDKILLGIALALLLTVFALAAFRPDPKSITEFVDIPAIRPDNTYEVSTLPEPDLDVPKWEEASAQSAGVEWVFDVFTPPIIYFNPQTETFTVQATPEPPAPPWPVELVTIREELYRIQLMGYVGAEGDFKISLENRETGQMLLAREGQEYADHEMAVRSFKIEEVEVQNAGGTKIRESIARVVIYDQRLDREVTLRSDVRKKQDESTAYFRVVKAHDEEFNAGVGDSFTYEGFTYTLDSITPPARATVTRVGGGEEPETKTFVAKEFDASAAAEQPAPEAADNTQSQTESDF